MGSTVPANRASDAAHVGQHGVEYAIVDLGSNSFHLLVAKVFGHAIRIVDRLKEVVRLSEGLMNDMTITPAKQDEASQVLRRFGQRLDGFQPDNVRVIGTSALRSARRATDFLMKAEQLLGFPIDVISGREEARLIYLGVMTVHQKANHRHLVVDIGGGSTELILGHGAVPHILESLDVGNISMTRKLFYNREMTPELFENATREIMRILQHSALEGRFAEWDVAIGASGTMRVVEGMLKHMEPGSHGISSSGLDTLVDLFLRSGRDRKMVLKGLPPDREETFPAALAILRALFRLFGISKMQVSHQGVREGLLFDMVRIHRTHDRRQQTLHVLMDSYGVDRQQVGRISEFINKNYPRIASGLQMDRGEGERLLRWAAYLHEVGISIRYSGYHKHGAYIVRNSEMPGFTRLEQGQIAFLILNQRKRIKLEDVPPEEKVEWGVLILFRLACLFHRARNGDMPEIRDIQWDGQSFRLVIDAEWLAHHPLTRSDLEREADYFSDVDVPYALH